MFGACATPIRPDAEFSTACRRAASTGAGEGSGVITT